MAVQKLNRCPSCGGYMFLYTYLDYWYAGCLQCYIEHELGEDKKSVLFSTSGREDTSKERESQSSRLSHRQKSHHREQTFIQV